ncbi:hypothetical protein F4703DRAFT_1933597 [Phycomyces blakesleeanus]
MNINSFLNDAANLPTNAVVENMAEAAYNFSNTVLGPKKIKKNPFNLYTKEMENKRKLDSNTINCIDYKKGRYYEMAEEDSATLHQESSVPDVNRGAKSILTIINTMKLSMNYNRDMSSIFFKCIEEDGALKSFLEAIGNVKRRPMREIQPATIAANDFKNKMNKCLISLFNKKPGKQENLSLGKQLKTKKAPSEPLDGQKRCLLCHSVL